MFAEAARTPDVAVHGELRLRHASGAVRWADSHVTFLAGEGVLLVQCVDVTERRGLEERLMHQAEHDPLTDLLNRRGFRRVLGEHMAVTDPEPTGAVMLIDLDHFKTVNDLHGHRVGDEVINAAARVLRESVRDEDTVARLGGDEFAVLLPGADVGRARATAGRLVDAVDAEAELASMAGGHGVSASVGVAMLDGRLRTPDDALVAADLAMYDAKDAGRRRFAFFDPDGGISSTQTRLQWVDRLRCALAEDRLVLAAQPIRDLQSGAVVHHELLLRLRDPDGTLVAPGQFLPIAEQFGLIGEIDRWVVTTAIRTLAANTDRDLVLEVNLSGSSLGDPDLLSTIRQELVAGAVDPRRIIFEITETAAVTNLDEARAFATELRGLGCRFALDDFGAGFGSFTYLKQLPFDFLKIDGQFVRHSATSATDRVILESLVHAARGLGKRTIAEFVEDERTEHLMGELGVDLVQGYHVGRPADLDEMIAAAPAQPRSVS
jgi:diguanylate cyclase (GGDEF)-like protein